MDWRAHIHSDPGILGGRPVFVGSRYTVERVLKLMGAGWSAEQIADEYPGITAQHLHAAAAFAADLLSQESFVATARARAA